MSGLKSTSQVGVREDLSDLIVLADVRATPLLGMLPKSEEPANMLFEWQHETLLNPTIAGRLSDDDRVDFENHSNRKKLRGYCQIHERAPKVGRVAQQINNVAGVGKKKEMARCVANAIKVAKRDIEATQLSSREGQEENGENPYLVRGMFVTADYSKQTDATTLVPVEARTPDSAIFKGTWGNVTEELLRDTMLGVIWEETGTMDDFQMFVGRELKSKVTSWMIYQPDLASNTIVRRFDRNLKDGDEDVTIGACVGTIEGDYGSISLTPSPWLRWDLEDGSGAARTRRRRCGIGFRPENHALRFNQQPGFRPFEDKGGGPRGLVESIGGREDKNPRQMLVIMPDEP